MKTSHNTAFTSQCMLICTFLSLALAVRSQSSLAEAEKALEARQYKQAMKWVEKAITEAPSNTRCYELKAQCHEGMEQYEEALLAYNKSVEMDPRNDRAYCNRGLLLASLQEYKYAREDLTKAIEYAKTDSLKYMYYVNRASTEVSVRDFESAYNDLMTAYRFDSTCVATLTNLGAVCSEVGKNEDVLKYLERVVQLQPDFEGGYANLGFHYQELGDHKKALEYYNKVLELDPDQPLGYSNRAYNRLQLGDAKGAMADIEKSIKLYPQNSYAYRIRALIYLKEGKMEEACEDLTLALAKGFTQMYGDEVEKLRYKHCR